jgi:hypothetical protein
MSVFGVGILASHAIKPLPAKKKPRVRHHENST